jgi:hypothetical protein
MDTSLERGIDYLQLQFQEDCGNVAVGEGFGLMGVKNSIPGGEKTNT